MPCNCDGMDAHMATTYKQKADKLARLLCEMIPMISGTDGCSLELRHWWEEHQAHDRRVAEQEKAEQDRKDRKAEALAKLTPADRRILGVK